MTRITFPERSGISSFGRNPLESNPPNILVGDVAFFRNLSFLQCFMT